MVNVHRAPHLLCQRPAHVRRVHFAGRFRASGAPGERLQSDKIRTQTMNAVSILAMTLVLLFSTCPARAQEFVLRGTISDVDGKPVAGAEVALYRGKNVKKPADFASKRTAGDGAYSVALPAGQYWALAVLRKGEKRFGPLDLGDRHSGEAVEITVGPEADLTHDFTVLDLREAARQNQKKNSALVRLSGRILDKDGQPLALAYAMAERGERFKDLPSYISAWSDSSGAYLLFLPKGRFYVGAATAFPPAAGLKLAREVNLTADMDGVDLVLP